MFEQKADEKFLDRGSFWKNSFQKLKFTGNSAALEGNLLNLRKLNYCLNKNIS